MGKLELSVIIVNYKSSQFTIELIKNLRDKLADLRFEIIVVDNSPDKEDLEKIRSSVKDNSNLKTVKAQQNLGFGAGNNLGAKSAEGEYLLLLNPDTKIVDDSIQKMLDFLANHPEVGALSPLLYQKDERTLQRHFFGQCQNWSSIIFRRRRLPELKHKNQQFFYTQMVSAAALMIRHSLFKKLGGFDENFFMYLEDDDLCRRINQLGLKNAVLMTAKIIHFEGQTSTFSQKKIFYYQSQNYYWQKHHGPLATMLMKMLRYPYTLWQKLTN